MKSYSKLKGYFCSPHLVFRCCYHVIFCPKYRHKILVGDVAERCKDVIRGVALVHDFSIESIECGEDHIHMIINCNPRYGVMKCIQMIKSISAQRLFDEFPAIRKTKLWGGKFWGRSTFVATVGSVSLDTVKKYIENQQKAG